MSRHAFLSSAILATWFIDVGLSICNFLWCHLSISLLVSPYAFSNDVSIQENLWVSSSVHPLYRRMSKKKKKKKKKNSKNSKNPKNKTKQNQKKNILFLFIWSTIVWLRFSVWRMWLFRILSSSDTPSIFIRHIISNTSSLFSPSFFSVHVSAPYERIDNTRTR